MRALPIALLSVLATSAPQRLPGSSTPQRADWLLTAELPRDAKADPHGVWVTVKNLTSRLRVICAVPSIGYSSSDDRRGGVVGRPAGICSSLGALVRVAPGESYSRFVLIDEPMAPGWRLSAVVGEREDEYPFKARDEVRLSAVVR